MVDVEYIVLIKRSVYMFVLLCVHRKKQNHTTQVFKEWILSQFNKADMALL